MKKMTTIAAVALLSLGVSACGGGTEPVDQGSTDQGSTDQGSTDQGSTDQGSTDQGSTDQ